MIEHQARHAFRVAQQQERWTTTVKLGNKKHLLVLSVAAVAVWSYVIFDSPTARQWRWIAESEKTLPRIQLVLDSDARFVGVHAFVSTGCEVIIRGSVRAEEDLRDLHSLLAPIEFPHGIIWQVEGD